MSNNRLYLFLILTLLIYAPAYAHPPYLIKQGLIADSDGNKVIKEKLYGDGVFVSDPVTFQLRNRHGALLANSPINDHVFSFCPSIDFCWVFTYSFISLFSFGWSLNAETVEFDKPAPNYEFKGDEEEDFKSYLNDQNSKQFSAYFLGYPEFNRSHSGFKRSWISALLSPFIIIADQFIQLLVIFLLTFVRLILFRLPLRWKKYKIKIVKYLLYTISALLIVVYLAFYAVVTLIIGVTFTTPVIYMLASIISGEFLAELFLKRKTSKDKKRNGGDQLH